MTMQDSSHTIREELGGVLAFMAAIWTVFVISYFFPGLDAYGVVPRTKEGLIGIAAMPFLHANLHHIMANTLPLFILLALLAGSRARSWAIVLDIVLLGGLLLWLFGRTADHIGASGLIFGLIAFLILSGLLERRIISLGIAILVGFAYGGTLLSGVLPTVEPGISWDGHLASAVAGGIVAYALTRPLSHARGLDAPQEGPVNQYLPRQGRSAH